MTPISGTVSGSLDLDMVTGGVYFTNIFYGYTPEAVSLDILYGGSNSFSSIEFQSGTTLSGGSVLIGSLSPSGVVQTFDLNTQTVIDVHSVPELEDDNVEDIS